MLRGKDESAPTIVVGADFHCKLPFQLQLVPSMPLRRFLPNIAVKPLSGSPVEADFAFLWIEPPTFACELDEALQLVSSAPCVIRFG